MPSYRLATLLGLTLSLTSINTFASDADQILVQNPYVREVPPMAMATGSFMMLKNNSNQAIDLVKAASTVADKVELHTHTHENGMMKMREVSHIRIPAKGETALKPGGYHVMLIGPKRALKQGEKVTIKLIFKDGSEKAISAPVKSVMRHRHH